MMSFKQSLKGCSADWYPRNREWIWWKVISRNISPWNENRAAWEEIQKRNENSINKSDMQDTLIFKDAIILSTEKLPASLSCVSVAFLPKVERPKVSSDFRLIAISSVLEEMCPPQSRMREGFKFFPIQYAFLQRNSCLVASSLLHAILQCTHEETWPLVVSFLDLTKAFDTIPHQANLRVGEKAGIPPPMLRYLKHQNTNADLHLVTITTKCRKGIRQGNPIYPILFILVICLLTITGYLKCYDVYTHRT